MEDRWLSYTGKTPESTQGTTATSMEIFSNHFNGMSLSKEVPMVACYGCMHGCMPIVALLCDVKNVDVTFSGEYILFFAWGEQSCCK